MSKSTSEHSGNNIPKKWYTVDEAAEYLRKAVKTIYNLRNQGRLFGTRSGGTGTLLFTLEELDSYVAGRDKRKREKL